MLRSIYLYKVDGAQRAEVSKVITPIVDHKYRIRFHGRAVTMQCLEIHHIDGFKSPHSNYRRSAVTRYAFRNLETGREVILKSRTKILSEVLPEGVDNPPGL